MADGSSPEVEPKSRGQDWPLQEPAAQFQQSPIESRPSRSSAGTTREEFYQQQRITRSPGPRLVEIRYSKEPEELLEPSSMQARDGGARGSRGAESLGRPTSLATRSATSPGKKRSSRGTKRSSKSQPEEEYLTEVADPRPVAPNEDNRHGRRDRLEDDLLAEDDDDATPPDFSRRTVSREEPPEKLRRRSRIATQIYIHCYLIFFSILGTLARLGVQWLTFYPGAPVVTPVLWANVGGSFFMGFLAEDQRLFRDEWGNSRREESFHGGADQEEKKMQRAAAKASHGKVKKTIPLYVGLATGFCGSFTSFSSFERDVFLALSNNLPTPDNHPQPAGVAAASFTSTVHRNGGYSFMALLAVILLTIGMSLAALFVGAHFALALDRFLPTLPFVFTRKVLDRLMVLLGLGCWLGAIILCIWPPDRPSGPSSRGSWANEVWRGEVLFALAFAPVGAIVRFHASAKLNGILPSFPLGTFAVNIFGTAVEGMCYDLQHVPLQPIPGMLAGGGIVGCQVLQGVMDGFCGCLTTVSTFVAELQGLRPQHAYVYGLVSVCTGLGVMVIVMGSVRWTVGWSDTACVTGRTSS